MGYGLGLLIGMEFLWDVIMSYKLIITIIAYSVATLETIEFK
jgi:hypothetical protein